MIITKTPFRMSFFGGGTDMPEFFNKNGGAVISTTFDKYCYVSVRHLPPFFKKYTSELVYAKIERVKSIDKIKHPLIREGMRAQNMHELRINYEADLPARTGLGTSSSFAVGMLNAFHALKKEILDKKTLANEAIDLERVKCKEAGGWQDQIAASFGGFNRIDFKNNEYTVKRLEISENRKKTLNDNLLLFYTGVTRISAEIQESTKVSMSTKTEQLKAMLALVDQAEDILTNDSIDIDEFGRLLDHTWQLKRKVSSKISNDTIDVLYNSAMRAGALGGKLLGAGGGGFLIFYVRPENQDSVKKAMKSLLHVPFKFEDEGTQILYNVPEFYDKNSHREK